MSRRSEMKNEKLFQIKLALFNTLGYCLVTFTSTFLDSRLTSHILWPQRTYPLGFWILMVGPLVFILTLICFKKVKSTITKIWLPSTTFAVIGFFSLLNFLPEFPHINVGGWILMYVIIGILTSWIHYTRIRDDYVTDSNISETARIERIKESVTSWRTLAVTFTAGYLSLLIPWCVYYIVSISKLVTNAKDSYLLKVFVYSEIFLFSIWVALGVLYESWQKANKSAELLLHIKAGKNLDT
jgi:hypothetical protein